MKREKKQSSKVRSKRPTVLQKLARRPDALFTGAFRQQCAALCYRHVGDAREVEVLIITSRDTGRWIIPKGWPIKGKTLSEAAEIEAWEEAGVKGSVRKKPVGRFTYLKDLDDGNVAPCLVDVFEIETREVVHDFKERGERILQWVTPLEAARRVREIELKSLLVEFKPRRRRSKN